MKNEQLNKLMKYIERGWSISITDIDNFEWFPKPPKGYKRTYEATIYRCDTDLVSHQPILSNNMDELVEKIVDQIEKYEMMLNKEGEVFSED